MERSGVLVLLLVVLRHWRVAVLLPLASVLATAGAAVFLPATYTASASFIPETGPQRRTPAGLAGLAGQFGIALGTETYSPRFYAAVLQSPGLLEHVVLTRFPDPRDGVGPQDSVALMQLLRARGHTKADSLNVGVAALRKQLSVRSDNQTGIVTLSFESRYPSLAAAVVNIFVRYLGDFNTRSRQSYAHKRREFIDSRLSAVGAELRTAEETYRLFLERNRSWQQSPQLVFEEGRLRRRVDIVQEVYLTLSREFEMARIEEVDNTPVITVLDSAVAGRHERRSKRGFLLIVALVFGAGSGLVWILGAEYLSRAKVENDGAYAEVAALGNRFRRHIASYWRRVSRRTLNG